MERRDHRSRRGKTRSATNARCLLSPIRVVRRIAVCAAVLHHVCRLGPLPSRIEHTSVSTSAQAGCKKCER
jgi:hypothetical protein